MQIFNCKVMRSVVVVSTVVFGLGLVLQLPTIVAWLQSPLSAALLSYLGLLLIVVSPLLLLVAAVVFSIPAVNHRLDSCQH
ncbi:MAG: hypothetical protein KDI83_19560 [Gammaproteobacteria bacterium]|nr:hypothetical protein [Gammaproteobacteria bacterium]